MLEANLTPHNPQNRADMQEAQIIHKTDHFTASQRGKLLQSAISQDEAIRSLFESGNEFTPSQVHHTLTRQRIISPKTPLTSIRRGINTLTKAGYLEKMDKVITGDFGMPEHYWRKKLEMKQIPLFAA